MYYIVVIYCFYKIVTICSYFIYIFVTFNNVIFNAFLNLKSYFKHIIESCHQLPGITNTRTFVNDHKIVAVFLAMKRSSTGTFYHWKNSWNVNIYQKQSPSVPENITRFLGSRVNIWCAFIRVDDRFSCFICLVTSLLQK